MGEGDFFQGKGVKNLNWEILTKNLVTFKRCNGVKDEKKGSCFWGGIDTPMHIVTQEGPFFHQLFDRYKQYICNDINWKNVALNVVSRLHMLCLTSHFKT